VAERSQSTNPGWAQRFTALAPWARILMGVVLIGVLVALSKWLVLLLLVALGLWPLTFLFGLGLLAIISTRRGGWPWMRSWLAARARSLAVPALSVISALLVGAFIIMVTDQAVHSALGSGQIGRAIALAFGNVARAYSALYEGAFGEPFRILNGIGRWFGGEGIGAVAGTVRGPSDSLVQSVPYIFAGLAVALGFRAGLFNIGAEGQIGVGWMAAVVTGFVFTGLPAFIHLPLAILAGAVAGGLWASIAGFLKAKTGAHEVITTIMLNYISFRLSEWLLCGPLEFAQGTCRTKDVLPTAFLPRFLDHPVTVHWGFILALGAAVLVGWFLFKTIWGFELRTVGANPAGARYGGMNVAKNYVLAMFLSGCLAGLGGVSQGLGITRNIALGFSAGYGFDSIALALLGKSHPAGVVGASLLFGALRAGAGRMQSLAGVPTEIVQIIQSLVIIFIAAPAIIRAVYRFRAARREEGEITVFSRGWGS
jgi:general nucleoside transport system permease protein